MKRADVQKWSQAATSKTLSEVSKQKSPLRVLDLPGVRDLEGRLLLYAGDPHRVEDEVARASRQLFGIGPRDTELEVPDEYWNLPESSPERRRIETLYAEHENRFETGDDLTDDEAMEILARFGLDFSDDRGQPLRCTKLMSRPAEAAAKGIKGKLPDGVMQWEDALMQERDAFLARKRK